MSVKFSDEKQRRMTSRKKRASLFNWSVFGTLQVRVPISLQGSLRNAANALNRRTKFTFRSVIAELGRVTWSFGTGDLDFQKQVRFVASPGFRD
jgi:hypothetical protein